MGDAATERRVLRQTRERIDPSWELPDEAIRSTGTYQWALFHERCLELGRSMRDSLPGPLRRLLGG